MFLRKLFFPFMAVCVLFWAGCKKSSDSNPSSPVVPDSATLVKTITSVNYDDQNRFVFLGRGVYDYSNAPQKIAVAIRDSDSYEIKDFAETYQYDNSNRLIGFTSTTKQWANKIDFQYNGNNELTKATTVYPNGNIIENTFKYQTINGFKVVTMYDTANVNYGGSQRPRIVTYTFDDSSRIVKLLEASTYYNNDRKYWYADTGLVSVQYNSIGDATKAVNYVSWHTSGGGYQPDIDSVIYTRESTGTEICNTGLYICRNLYWFSLSEYATGFSEGGISTFGNLEFTPALYTWKHPVKQIQDWSNGSYWGPYSNGVVQNTFGATGLLMRMVYPPLFGSKYGGKSIFDYTYVKVRL